jgi:hypothetical protein
MTDSLTNISMGDSFGCLTVIDDTNSYYDMIDAKISAIKAEKDTFIKLAQEGKLQHRDWHGWDGQKEIITPAYIYNPVTIPKDWIYSESVCIDSFNKAIERYQKEIKRYKCKCRLCGKVRYYSADTLMTNPKYCYRPIFLTDKFSYSVRANNATYNKKKKYAKDDSVRLLSNRDEIIPADEYCNRWNDKREKELKKQAEKNASIIAAIPRVPAKNYDVDFIGCRYESLDMAECVDAHYESAPIPYYNQRHQKLYRDITVYKRYRCKCYLCGKEQLINCDRFGIFPPTEYGYRAYDGYWSAVFCDCHKVSSFQWIVTDILMKHDVDYSVEVSLDGLYGIDGRTPLRFDFAVYNPDGGINALIECQGEQHYKPVEEFGGERRFQIQQLNDNAKRKYVEEHGIQFIEISYKDKQYEKIENILKLNKILD